MLAFPHHYTVEAAGSGTGDVELKSDGLPILRSASPIPFDGPGDRWSPETLLVAAVGDCLILTLRAVARASGFVWTSLECDVTGTLDRIERTTRFVAFEVRARLRVPAGTDPDRARQVLEKAERSCLISNSLSGAIHLIPTIDVAGESVGELTAVD
ncbi:MAG TPA: OsmC family protein [Vicinamibacterales bacterium]|jgi:organic hydroperoxide reductase OsmC/OhrA|nr:OsmC family protein [Vicinamibacterales bacterium]